MPRLPWTKSTRISEQFRSHNEITINFSRLRKNLQSYPLSHIAFLRAKSNNSLKSISCYHFRYKPYRFASNRQVLPSRHFNRKKVVQIRKKRTPSITRNRPYKGQYMDPSIYVIVVIGLSLLLWDMVKFLRRKYANKQDIESFVR